MIIILCGRKTLVMFEKVMDEYLKNELNPKPDNEEEAVFDFSETLEVLEKQPEFNQIDNFVDKLEIKDYEQFEEIGIDIENLEYERYQKRHSNERTNKSIAKFVRYQKAVVGKKGTRTEKLQKYLARNYRR